MKFFWKYEIFRKSELFPKIWEFSENLKPFHKSFANSSLFLLVWRVASLSECSMVVFFNNVEWLTDWLTEWVSDKVTYWAVWGQLKIRLFGKSFDFWSKISDFGKFSDVFWKFQSFGKSSYFWRKSWYLWKHFGFSEKCSRAMDIQKPCALSLPIPTYFRSQPTHFWEPDNTYLRGRFYAVRGDYKERFGRISL